MNYANNNRDNINWNKANYSKFELQCRKQVICNSSKLFIYSSSKIGNK